MGEITIRQPQAGFRAGSRYGMFTIQIGNGSSV
jgi:hypothetical protein